VKNTLFTLLFLLAVSAGYAQRKNADDNKLTQNVLTSQEIETGWKLLFDGTTTQGWRGYNHTPIPASWTAENGMLISYGKGGDMSGDIVTDELYEDFDLYLEWALEKGGNSGIFFHIAEGISPVVYTTAPEYQLIDDVGFPEKLEDWQMAGANYAMHPAKNKTLKPIGEFNSSRIRVENGHVTHWLNDDKIVEYDLWTDEWKNLAQKGKWKDYPDYGLARKGNIGLQDHGSVIKFRNIKIKDLTDVGKPVFNGKNLDGWKINGTEKWYVEDGLLVCESGPDKQYGYLTTEKDYKDFLLRLRFKQEANGNSGVFFRSSVAGVIISGWQVEVAPPGQSSGAIYESYGRGWLNKIPEYKQDVVKMGEWNEMMILVQGDRVMTWLNSILITDLKDEKIGQANGKIALQIHDGGGIKVKWDDIFIKSL
jgi:hypothetical protein